MPYLRDETQEVARAFGAKTTPDVFVLDGEGRLRYRGAPDADHGDPSLNAAWLREALDALRAGDDPARPETEPVGCSVKWRLIAPSIAAAASVSREVLQHRVGLGRAQLVESAKPVATATARAPASRAARTSSGVSPTSTAPVGSPYLAAARSRAIATSS